MKNKLTLAVAAFISTSPVLAQDQNDDANIEELVVTGVLTRQIDAAGRLGLSNRETPAIVDVITQDELQNQGIRTAIEAMNAAPGVTSGALPGSMGSVSMRGFHRAVNFLYDGVRMANSDVGVRNWDVWAYERIEVIKGPASVTSGEGALAGAINYVPRRPQFDEASAEFFASFGSFASKRVAVDLNTPHSESLASRFNVSWSESDGWIDDTDSDSLAVNGALTFRPTDRFSATFRADYSEDQYDTAYYGTPVVSREIAQHPSDVVSGSAGLVLDEAMDDLNFNVTDGDMGSETLWLRVNAQYQLSDSLKIVSDTSWYSSDRRWKDSDEYSFDASSGLINRYMTHITHDHEFLNQKVHLVHEGALADMRNRFSIGAEFGKTDFFTLRRFGVGTPADPFDPVRETFLADTPANFGTRQDVSAEVQSWAIFAENAINLTSDWLLVAGARLDTFELDRTVKNVTSNTSERYGQDYDGTSWRLGAVYSVTPHTQLFAQYTEAVTPVTGLLFMSSSRAEFDLTTGYSYEAGVKTSFIGEGVELTVSVFKIRQDDILTRDVNDPTITYQGGNQQSQGLEFAINLPATDALNIGLSASLLDAEYGELTVGGGVSHAGNLPQNVSEKLADLVVSYSPDELPFTLSGNIRYNGGFYTSSANTVKVNAYTTLDAAIAWDIPIGTVTLRGRNLTDEFYADWSGYSSGLVFVGASRSVELSMAIKY